MLLFNSLAFLISSIEETPPDIITGQIVGKYKVNQLQKMVENALGSLYANYAPNKLDKEQFLDFNLTIYDKIVEVFVPEVKISENTKLAGKINGDEGRFVFDFTSPNIIAYNNTIENVKIDIDNKNPLYNAYITVDSIKNSKYKIADFNLINVTLNDTLFVRSEFKGGQKSQDAYDLNLYHTINEEKQSIIGFKKSEIKFKDYLWFINELENGNVTKLFNEIELPLVSVLAAMEIEGINLNTDFLKELSVHLTEDINRLEKNIFEQAGEEFNIASPKQLGIVLFENMRLVDKPKKTKTGQYSTAEDVLSYLAKEHEIIANVLEYRQYKKLQSTY